MGPLRVLDEADIRRLVGPAAALPAVRDAFVRLARGEVSLPGVIHLDVPPAAGEVHVKGAWLHGSSTWSIKVATGFAANAASGRPVAGGCVLVFDAGTGYLKSLLRDNGYLTELRTGAAGALAADLLARRDVETVGVVGAGSQARYQVEALLGVRPVHRVLVWSRTRERAEACARELADRHGLAAEAAAEVRAAVEASDVVVTVTPSRVPLVRAEWLRPGTHVTAVGSDDPTKQELEPAVLARADLVVADRLDQCLRFGEIHHAVAAGAFSPDRVYGELGALAAGLLPGRTSATQVTVADLTGVGVQDAAMADLVEAAAAAAGLGRTVDA